MEKKISTYVTNLYKMSERIKLGAKLKINHASKTFVQQNCLYTNSFSESEFVLDGIFDVNTACSVPIMCKCAICDEKKITSAMVSVSGGNFGVMCCRACLNDSEKI